MWNTEELGNIKVFPAADNLIVGWKDFILISESTCTHTHTHTNRTSLCEWFISVCVEYCLCQLPFLIVFTFRNIMFATFKVNLDSFLLISLLFYLYSVLHVEMKIILNSLLCCSLMISVLILVCLTENLGCKSMGQEIVMLLIVVFKPSWFWRYCSFASKKKPRGAYKTHAYTRPSYVYNITLAA